jgi:hypothetical protein
LLTIAAKKNKKAKSKKQKKSGAILLHSPKRPSEYQGYRAAAPDRATSGTATPILIGAAMIAVAILLSTLITAVGTRFVGIENPAEDAMWLVDRLNGSVYKCRALEHGKASCDAEIATGSIGGRSGLHPDATKVP